MKWIIPLACSVLTLHTTVFAQPPRSGTTTRDTTLATWNITRAQLVHTPILLNTSVGTTIVPVRQRFCFDMAIDIELFYGGANSMKTCLFINSTDGYIGYTPLLRDGPINMLMPEVEAFQLTIVSYKMKNIYHYFNRKPSRSSEIQHWVSTSNTETHDYQMVNMLTSEPLDRKIERRRYIEGNAEALSYKTHFGPTVLFMYGDRYPATLTVQKYIGLFGVGVVKTDAGVYVMMEMQNGANYTAIKHIEKAMVCFDPTNFKMQEAEFYASRNEDLEKERIKIERAEAIARNASTCSAERMAEVNFKKEQLLIKEENLRISQAGNLQQNVETQNAMTSVMDPLPIVQGSILSTKTKLCQANSSNSASREEKIACLNHQLSVLMNAESEMRAVNLRYPRDPGMAISKKSTIYMVANREMACD